MTTSDTLWGGSGVFGSFINSVYGDARVDSANRVQPYGGNVKGIKYPRPKTVRFAVDPQDALEQVRYRIIKAANEGDTTLGLPVVSDAQLQWLQRKQEFTQYDDFLAWCSRNLPRGTPEERQLFDKLVPELAEVSGKYSGDARNLAAQIVKIRRDGPENRQDLVIIYMLAMGLLRVPTINEMVGCDDIVKSDPAIPYVRGLWNPVRTVTTSAKCHQMKPEQAAALGNVTLPGLDFPLDSVHTNAYWSVSGLSNHESTLWDSLFTSLYREATK